mgnify:CR=1 FL=1
MVRIITDSTCDLTQSRQAALKIEVAPLSVRFGEESFLDGEEITNQEFYNRLRAADSLPTTSQVNPDVFAQLFRRHVEAGDQVVGIFIASQLSGTYQSACIARDMVDEKHIFVVDSDTVTFGLGLLVEHAVTLRDQGMSAGEIAAEIQRLSQRVRLLAVVGTLKYLKMGGRISGASAVVGGMLGITPILDVKHGVVESPAKTRGRKAAFQWMERQMEQSPPDLSLPVIFGHSDAPAVLAECRDYFVALLDLTQWLESDIGSVVGTHAGPGAAGIAFFTKE